ncbi:MAG TPA: hypothetical protein VJN89_09910 [Candidatus Acidoferrum sp.]|nr:hypothetical protein [Candidatus Acidoferrum sp.]
MDQLELVVRNLLGYNHSVIAKYPDAVSNTQYPYEFVEFHAIPVALDI